jgi:protein-S-isoprenylcysteine O-methyltransferase Ste14
MSLRQPNVSRALRFGLFQCLLVLLGILFVHREIWQLRATTFTLNYWQDWVLIALSAIDGAITGAYATSARHLQNKPAYGRLIRWALPAFLVLFVACSALCERLSVGLFRIDAEIVRSIGLLVIVGGLAVRICSQAATSSALVEEQQEEAAVMTLPTGPHKLLRHPDAAGQLLILLGIPLVFNSWIPLLALPGVIVLLKWHISDQEAFRISQIGEPYLEYRKGTWNLIPFIY